MKKLLLSVAALTISVCLVVLLFTAGSAWADDKGEANELFVEAVRLVKSTKNVESVSERVAALKKALAKLNEIIDDHPSSDLAVKLISGQGIGMISLDLIRREIEEAPKRAERERKEAKRLEIEAVKVREIEKVHAAAEQGDVNAQYKLGKMYWNGIGGYENGEWNSNLLLRYNEAEAIKWYLKAAEQGHADAQTDLGLKYKGELRDTAEAFKWLSKAAEQGHVGGQYELGQLYSYGGPV